MISDTISYDEIYQSIMAYRREKQNDAAYILIHPETRHKILISSQDEANGMHYRVVNQSFTRTGKITSTHKMFGLYLIQTYDVEAGFIIICG